MFSYKPLWHLLIEKSMTRTQFREALRLSSATLAKMGKDEYVSLEVIDKVCSFFGVPIERVIEHRRDDDGGPEDNRI